MAATFIISLDCEGKWGMADAIDQSYDFITKKTLTSAYSNIVSEMAVHDIKATFAFVGAFVLTDQEQKDNEDMFIDVQYRGQNWLRHYREAVKSGNTDGWFCPDALELARDGGHELASHGFSHVPFDCPTTADSDLEFELACAVKIAQLKNHNLETFIYPRNLLGRLELMKQFGFTGYRDRLVGLGRGAALAREFNVRSKSQDHSNPALDPIVIPPGNFFNWRKKARALVPKAVTVARWKSIIDNAIANDNVAHLWFHPHNIIDAPATFDVLRDVLKYAAENRDAGVLSVCTQADYVKEMCKSRNKVA